MRDKKIGKFGLRNIKKILISSVLFSVGVLLLLYGLCTTEVGLNLVFYTGKAFVPGKIKIEKISGSIFKAILIQGLEYQNDQVRIKIHKLNLKGDGWGILKKNVNIEQFVIEEGVFHFIGRQKNNLGDAGDLNNALLITHATGNLNYLPSEKQGHVKLTALQGSYQQQPLQMEGAIYFDKNLLNCEPCYFIWGPHTFTLSPVARPAENLASNAVVRIKANVASESGDTVQSSTLHWEYHKKIDNRISHDSSRSKKSDLWTQPFHMQGEITCLPGQMTFQNTQLKMGKRNMASLKGNLSWNIKEKQKEDLQGNFQIDITDLSPLYHGLPNIARLKANPHITFDISGSFKKPQIKVQAEVNHGSFSIPKQRINVKQFQLKISGILNDDLWVQSTGVIAGNPFYFQGHWNPFKSGMPGKFQFTGNALRMMNTENIRIMASPNLQLNYSDHKLVIQGNVTIIEGHVILKQELNSVIVSNDIQYLGSEDLNTSLTTFLIQPEIQFIIQDNLQFKGYGLDAKIGGKLYIEQRKDGLYTGQGRIVLRDGKYRLPNGLGTIRRGYLYYPTGTLLHDPRIDIRVLQHARDKLNEAGDVGVYVQGSLQKPIYNLYSSQALKQNEILSKLGFGGTQFEGEDNQHKMLSQTAVLLGGGSNPLIENIQTKFGLEEFGIQSGNATKYIATQEGNDATLVVGKSLSDRFYLQFMQGMLVPSSTLKLQYFLTPNIAISGETSTTGLGGDISFSVEKD